MTILKKYYVKARSILIISPEAWGNNFVSKHHYANYLSKENVVYFLNPASAATINPFKKNSIDVINISENLIAVNYYNPVPKLNATPGIVQDRIYAKLAKKIQHYLAIDQFDIVWSFDPYRFVDLNAWKAKKYIYHSVDIHYKAKRETEIANAADLVLLSSPTLKTYLPNGLKSHVIGHGLDIESNDVYLHQLPGTNRLKASIVGNFNNYIDYPLISKLSEDHPELDFIFIGPYTTNNLGGDLSKSHTEVSQLQQLVNIHFIGSVDYIYLNDILSKTALNLVLYKESIKVLNPHKLLTYIYSGKPTISSFIHDYKAIDSDMVLMCNSNLKISERIREVTTHYEHYFNHDLQLKRKQYAEVRAYPVLIAKIETLLYS